MTCTVYRSCIPVTHSTTRTLVKPVIIASAQLHVKSRRVCWTQQYKGLIMHSSQPGAVLALSTHTAFCSQPFSLPRQEKGLARVQDLAVCFGERAENNLFTGLLETPNYLVAIATCHQQKQVQASSAQCHPITTLPSTETKQV